MSICIKPTTFSDDLITCADEELPTPWLSQQGKEFQQNLEKFYSDLSQDLTALNGGPYQVSILKKLGSLPLAPHWKRAQYDLVSIDHIRSQSVSKVSLEIPLEIKQSDRVLGYLNHDVELVLEVSADGEVKWEVESHFNGPLKGVAAFLDANLNQTENKTADDFFLPAFQESHVDYALLAPYLWGNGEFSEKIKGQPGQKPLPDLNQIKENPRSLLIDFSIALTQEGLSAIDLSQILSIIPQIDIETDSYWNDDSFWQQFSYGEILYLETLIQDKQARFALPDNLAIQSLFKNNLNRLEEVRAAMHHPDDDDVSDDGIDPELRDTALDHRNYYHGPLPPLLDIDLPPGTQFVERMVDVAAQRARERLPEIKDLAQAEVERLTPVVEARMKEIEGEFLKRVDATLKDINTPERQAQVEVIVRNYTAKLKPIVAGATQAMVNDAQKRVTKALPKIKKQLETVAEDFEKNIYPQHVKPIVGEVLNMISSLMSGEGSAPSRRQEGTTHEDQTPAAATPKGKSPIPKKPGDFKKGGGQ